MVDFKHLGTIGAVGMGAWDVNGSLGAGKQAQDSNTIYESTLGLEAGEFTMLSKRIAGRQADALSKEPVVKTFKTGLNLAEGLAPIPFVGQLALGPATDAAVDALAGGKDSYLQPAMDGVQALSSKMAERKTPVDVTDIFPILMARLSKQEQESIERIGCTDNPSELLIKLNESPSVGNLATTLCDYCASKGIKMGEDPIKYCPENNDACEMITTCLKTGLIPSELLVIDQENLDSVLQKIDDKKQGRATAAQTPMQGNPDIGADAPIVPAAGNLDPDLVAEMRNQHPPYNTGENPAPPIASAGTTNLDTDLLGGMGYQHPPMYNTGGDPVLEEGPLPTPAVAKKTSFQNPLAKLGSMVGKL